MMNKNKQNLDPVEQEFGKRVTRLLSAQSENLSSDIQSRLQDARATALSRAKPEPVFVAQLQTTHRSFRTSSWNKPIWSFTGWLVPITVVVLGLIAITEWQEDLRINDIANVDIALLTDDVPPDAFVDNGFMAFLKLKTLAKPETDDKKSDDEKI
ncbi:MULTISPECIES: DUF3619 family protein [unclassified Polynucleobacter]|uniref:DUF3619 family protein n=1 Tax=unclassified Polynucleobacter TaxID=2640945 RepID=UPI00257381CD|nr:MULTISPECIES: DUF3619 family protein [unclassified Polynucleobacter]BEI35691.1 hypothetical protein PHIN6_12090 [Polynucleobacter sp. HIN6]BEI41262.1 hypothetical protein PHIN9_11930 [Polynucleobacter sp. HIN9]BEI43034.1 hypothetical protein PHIN10_11830 [Polynucleobacter sp. HIN10]BEI44811.1 hypothetical protein PHIN11_11830 [Polynucleobacter sp. HIN11]